MGFAKYIIFAVPAFMFPATAALALYSTAKRRNIMAFTAQQTMPVAQEGIEKMSPTIGKAAGSIGKEIAKGIKEGLNEADKKNEE